MDTEKSILHSKFSTVLAVRPDDIDMNNHVHSSRYFDYVLAARYDQMERCYKMSMDEFIQRGFGWVISACSMNFKRSLLLGDTAVVYTQIHTINSNSVDVHFEIVREKTGKLCVDGFFTYTMVNLATQRAEKIPQDIIDKYSV
jgi:acyl-CoA thioester hydrolase/thioesterase-3